MRKTLMPHQKNAFKYTFLYFLFGLIFFIINDMFLVHDEAYTEHMFEIFRNFTLLILSGILFYIILLLHLKKKELPEYGLLSLRKTLFNSSFIVIITDGKGIIREVNQKFIRLTGYKPKDIIGQSLQKFSELDKDKFNKLFEDLKNNYENFSEMAFIRQDGSKFYELATILPLENKNSQTIEYLKISSEISHLKEKENQLINEKNRMFSLNDAKTQFITSLSQEIRTPMSGIMGMTELMTLTELTKQQKEYVEIINFSSSTLLAIINDILDFSRIETGKLKLEKLDFNLRELINKTVQIFDLDAKKKMVSIKLNFDESIKYRITGDPLRLNQVFINILKNSIKQTDFGSIEINVRKKSQENNNIRYEFVIIDTGAPIPQKIIDELNLQNEPPVFTSSFDYKGLGLGFTIVKYLVSIMGGKLDIVNNERTGNTITLEIPFETPVSQERPKPSTDRILPGEIAGGVLNILVAEDNFVNQRLVKELLARKNYNVDIVDNGLKIFDLLEEKRYDIILMDIQMPVMDGIEATSIIREIEKGTGKHTPIIGITAYSVMADREKCMEAGMDDYLQKPFIKEEFYKLIERYTKK